MKLLKAELKNGVVHIDDVPAADVEILAKGEKNSAGRVLIGDKFAVYIVDTQPDLVDVIGKLSEICEQLITIGNNQYIVGAQGQVLGQPLLPVAQNAETLKQYLEGFKPL